MIDMVHSILMCSLETWGLIYFLDTFMESRFVGTKRVIRYFLFFLCEFPFVQLTSRLAGYGVVIKVFVVIALIVLFCILNYRMSIITYIFFSSTDYFLLFFVDCVVVSMIGMAESMAILFVGIGLRFAWIALLVFIRHKLYLIKRYLHEDRISWMRFSWLTVFSGFIGIYLYIMFIAERAPDFFYAFVSVVILFLNILSLFSLQDSLVREERIYQSETQLLKHRNQMQAFLDLKSVYERQGKKLHDYKKQMMTLNELIRKGEIDSAIKQTEDITESISIELSEINVGHPVMNAILNQEYRLAKGKDIGMTFSVCDLSGLIIDGEDVVTIFGNLLDNAIRACEKTTEKGRSSTIQIKMAYTDSNYIFSIKNPILEKVTIVDNSIVDKIPEGHGVGLINVRDAIDKYGGSFAISCDETDFTAIVILPMQK